jgi:hypothetical protein
MMPHTRKSQIPRRRRRDEFVELMTTAAKDEQGIKP